MSIDIKNFEIENYNVINDLLISYNDVSCALSCVPVSNENTVSVMTDVLNYKLKEINSLTSLSILDSDKKLIISDFRNSIEHLSYTLSLLSEKKSPLIFQTIIDIISFKQKHVNILSFDYKLSA